MTSVTPNDHEANWTTYVTGDLIAASKLSIGDGYRAKNSELARAGIPFARAGNIDGGFHFEDADRFPEKDLAKVGDKISRAGDVVFTSKGTVGRLAFVCQDTPRFVYAPQLCFWRALDPEVIHDRWLYYWMCGREFRQQMTGVKSQTDMADYVSLSDQRRMRITVPPIRYQRAAAQILGALDDKIELNRRMNRMLEALARAVFRAWFVDFEPVKAKAAGATQFPGMPQPLFDQLATELVASELGPIPAGWPIAAIADIAEYVNGRAFTKQATGTGRMVIRIAELNSGPGASTQYSDIDTEPEYTAFPDDLLFAWSGSLGVYRWHRNEAIINQHIFKVIAHDRPNWYVYYRLIEEMPFFQAIASTKATTMGHIKRGHLSDARFAEPSGELIQAAGDVIQPLFDVIHSNEREALLLADIRDALLPKLISGEVRVDVTETAVAGAG